MRETEKRGEGVSKEDTKLNYELKNFYFLQLMTDKY